MGQISLHEMLNYSHEKYIYIKTFNSIEIFHDPSIKQQKICFRIVTCSCIELKMLQVLNLPLESYATDHKSCFLSTLVYYRDTKTFFFSATIKTQKSFSFQKIQ